MPQENRSFIKALFIALTIGLITSLVGLLPRPDSMVLVIANPLSSKQLFSIIAEADGLLVSEFSNASAAVARNATGAGTDFIEKLYASGAFFVLDAQGFLACFYPERLAQLLIET